jgi:hypothetical protein
MKGADGSTHPALAAPERRPPSAPMDTTPLPHHPGARPAAPRPGPRRLQSLRTLA